MTQLARLSDCMTLYSHDSDALSRERIRARNVGWELYRSVSRLADWRGFVNIVYLICSWCVLAAPQLWALLVRRSGFKAPSRPAPRLVLRPPRLLQPGGWRAGGQFLASDALSRERIRARNVGWELYRSVSRLADWRGFVNIVYLICSWCVLAAPHSIKLMTGLSGAQDWLSKLTQGRSRAEVRASQPGSIAACYARLNLSEREGYWRLTKFPPSAWRACKQDYALHAHPTTSPPSRPQDTEFFTSHPPYSSCIFRYS